MSDIQRLCFYGDDRGGDGVHGDQVHPCTCPLARCGDKLNIHSKDFFLRETYVGNRGDHRDVDPVELSSFVKGGWICANGRHRTDEEKLIELCTKPVSDHIKNAGAMGSIKNANKLLPIAILLACGKCDTVKTAQDTLSQHETVRAALSAM